jgi:hypothetical protein
VADLPPGFENGFNERFDRPIGLECMSCHNAMPTEFVAGSTNKFSKAAGRHRLRAMPWSGRSTCTQDHERVDHRHGKRSGPEYR